jgi:hypothetical protein
MLVAAVPCAATSHDDVSAADVVLPSLEALPRALEGLGVWGAAPAAALEA